MPLFSEGAVHAIDEHTALDAVAEVVEGQSALGEILRLAPDVAVLDLELLNKETPELLRELSRAGSRTRVIFVSGSDDAHCLQEHLASGVTGYLSKRTDADEMRRAVIAVANGDVVISDGMRRALMKQLQQRGDGQHLTARETEVMQHIAQGESCRQVGGELHLSEATVKTYLQRIYGKLGVSSQAAAVYQSMRRHFIE